MGLDQLLELMSRVAQASIPIIVVVALIFLIVFLYRLIKVAKESMKTLEELTKTLTTANRQLNALDQPLHTLNELSETVDQVHEVSRNLVRSALVAIIENVSVIRDWIFAKVQKDTEETVSQTSEES